MTIKARLVTSLYNHDIFFVFVFILEDCQTGLCEKYLVTGDWNQSTVGADWNSVWRCIFCCYIRLQFYLDRFRVYIFSLICK